MPQPQTESMTTTPNHTDREIGPEANRLSPEALICVDWLSGDPEDPLGSRQPSDYRTGLDEPTAAAVSGYEVEAARHVRLRETDAGRGASFTGVAIELMEPIAVLGGTAAAIREAIRAVAWGYHRTAEAMRRRPLISLGTAEYLAVADRLDRCGVDNGVLTSGDINRHSSDRSFTGGDAFYVVLSTTSELHHYQVSAYGEVSYVGGSPLVPFHGDPAPAYLGSEEASRGRHNTTQPGRGVARRAWRWLVKADGWLSKLLERLWRWVVRYILHTARAVLAGSGFLGLLTVAVLLAGGVGTIPTLWWLGVLLGGGATGFVVRRYCRRIALFVKVDRWLDDANRRATAKARSRRQARRVRG